MKLVIFLWNFYRTGCDFLATANISHWEWRRSSWSNEGVMHCLLRQIWLFRLSMFSSLNSLNSWLSLVGAKPVKPAKPTTKSKYCCGCQCEARLVVWLLLAIPWCGEQLGQTGNTISTVAPNIRYWSCRKSNREVICEWDDVERRSTFVLFMTCKFRFED